MNQPKKQSEKKPTVDSGKQQLVQAFLLLAMLVLVAWLGWLIYYSEPLPPEMVHVEVGK